MNSRFNTRTIVEAGMMLALAVVLGLIKFGSLPFGGSVTAGSMIPLLLIAMMRGPVVGITVGVLCGVINYFL
ncbi:MAG: energy-coupled thiamine transporter ThiT, partial [Eubacteriales bacterium]|nr:energy-coupled thiamine transporter ThiT [Eubacteriales bacterium]